MYLYVYIHIQIIYVCVYIYIKNGSNNMLVGSYECQDENKINIIHSTLPTWQTQLKIFKLVNINVVSYKLHSKGWK